MAAVILRRTFIGWLGFALLLAGVMPGRAVTTELIAPGVYHDTYMLSDPNVVHVIRMDLSHLEYKLQLGFSQKKRNYTAKEGVSVICPRYEAPGNHVIAAVNGSYFNVAPADNGISGMLVDAAGYVKLADASREMICINDARTLRIEQAANSSSPTLTFADGTTASANNYMMARATDGLACYMTTWGPTTGTTNQGVEVVVSDVSYPIKPQKEVSGVVTAIRTGAASVNNAIPSNGIVLSADGTAATNLLAKIALGDRVYLKATISKSSFYWCNFALSGNGYLLQAGVPVDAGTTKDPQTALAWIATTFFMMTVDGRQTGSIGMSWNDMASFLLNTLGATDAIALDSGGSTTMWINGEGVVNSPSDGSERAVANAVMLVNAPTATVFPLEDDFTSAGRSLKWDDKFRYSAVSAFSPTAPGGDGYVMTVKNPGGGPDSARVGDLADTDYTVEAWIYCEYRASKSSNGYERCGIFARDNGNQAFTSPGYLGNCYTMIYKTDTGQLQTAKVVDGVITDFLASAPIYLANSAWHKFSIRCYGSKVQYLLDDTVICSVEDATFSHGYCGIGYHSLYASNSNIHGTRVENFKAVVEPTGAPGPASLGIGLDAGGHAGLNLSGNTGATYRVEFAAGIPSANWTPLTNMTLSVSPSFCIDGTSGANTGSRFYRAVLVH
jgi:hypothetical protein